MPLGWLSSSVGKISGIAHFRNYHNSRSGPSNARVAQALLRNIVLLGLLAMASVAAALTPQTITFAALANKTYGNAPFPVSATASSGLPVSFSSMTTAVCTVSVSTIAIVAAGTCTIRASQAGNATYAAAPNVDRGFTAAKAAQTITFAALAGKTFGNPPFTVTATASSGLAVSFASTTTTICTVGGSTVTIVAAGTCTIRASQAGNANYLAAPNVDRSFTVAKAAQTITFAALAGKTFGNPPFTVSATASSGLTVSFASTTTAICTVNGSTVTIVAAGTCTIRASQAGNANYLAAPNVDRSFTVAKASQTITFGMPANTTVFGTPVSLSATASSGLAVTFSSLTTSICRVSGNLASGLTGGTCTIRASQAGNANYAAAANVSQSLTVAKASQSITFDPIANVTIFDGLFDVNAVASSSLPVSIVSTTATICTISGITVTIAAVGTCTLRASQAGDSMYSAAPNVDQSFSVTLYPQSITFIQPENQLLGVPPFSLVAGANSGLPVTFTSLTTTICTVTGNEVTVVAIGTCSIRASQSGDASYAAAPNVDRSFLIAIANQIITFAAIAAKAVNLPPFALTASASSNLPVAFASLTPAICTVNGNVATLVALGTCTIRASQAGDATFFPAPNVDRSFAVTTPPAVQYFYDAAGNVVRIQRN